MTATTLSGTDLSFGEWLRRRRGGLGLTRAEFAKQLGCAIVTLRKFEVEERRPSREMAERIAVFLRVPTEQTATFVRFARGELRAGEQLSADVADPGTTTGNGVQRAPVPIPPYAIIGREDELERAGDAITKGPARVLTLVGPPGVGKTRLAIELARTLRATFADGAVFVELAPVRDTSLVPSAVAEALRIEDSTSADTAAAVMAALRDRHMLLVLDNFEHVIDAAPFVAELVVACKGVVCLITSRERLRVRAEHVLNVPTLNLPQTDRLEHVQAAAASRLFVACAQQANSQFTLTAADAPAIAALCTRLDGLPLALELLAARADIFTPQQLRDDLIHGLDALEDGPRDLPERQRTLRNAIRSSVRLLTEAQQTQFTHLAVFAGSFDAEAAQAVCGCADNALQALLRRSLVQPFGEGRWRVLEPIRQYAEEMLAQRDELDDAMTRYAAHMAEVAEAARDGLAGVDAVAWTARMEADCDNTQAVIQWSLRAKRPEFVLRIGQGIFRYWHRHGMWREALAWLEEALQLDERGEKRAPLDIRARATRAAGIMAYALSQFDRAERYFQTSLELAYQLKDDEQVAATYVSLGMSRRDQGRYDEALTYFDQAIPLEPEHTLKFPWQQKANTLLRLGRFDEAEVLYQRAMALNIHIGDDEGLAHTLRGLGEIAWRRGDADTAEKHLRDNEVLCRKLNDMRGLSWTAQQLGNAARTRGDWREAANRYAEALAQLDFMGDRWGECEVMAECGHLTVATEHYEIAARWLGMAQEGFRALGAKLTPYEQGLIDASLNACAQHLDAQTMQRAANDGAQDWRDADVKPVIDALQEQGVDEPSHEPQPAQTTRDNAQDHLGGLTPREREVAVLIAQSKSNREIAAVMVVSLKTVETYVSRILAKLSFSSRVQIATWAIERGLTPSRPNDA